MKYFSAISDAEFARSAFTAAGLDFDAAKAAKNADVIKAWTAAAVAAVKPSVDVEEVLKQAKKENDELTTTLADTVTAAGAQRTELVNAVDGLGLKVSEAKDKDGKFSSSALKAQQDGLIAKGARELLARSGHVGLPEEPTVDPTKKGKTKIDDSITGRDRVAASFAPMIPALLQQRAGKN